MEDKQLGPNMMKKKVNQQLQYNQWNPGPSLSAKKNDHLAVTPLKAQELHNGAKSSN